MNTLKRPKRKPPPEYFLDEERQNLVQPHLDPQGSAIDPIVGEKLIVPSGLPRSIESALQRYAGLIGQTPAFTCIELSGRSAQILTYAKMLQRTTRIAYHLLTKIGQKGDQSLQPGDRVGLVYSNNEPIPFILAFYGCLLASVVPIAIELPTQTSSASQEMGLLLASQKARFVLTTAQFQKSLPRGPTGEVIPSPGWPQVTWVNTDHQMSGTKPPKAWTLPDRFLPDEIMYIEYTFSKQGSVYGVPMSRKATLTHCRTLTAACHYSEEDIMVCLVDCRREVGLWHAVFTSVFSGMHVVFIPYSVLQVEPGSWIRIITKYRASVAVVKSRDLHWALLAEKDHAYANLSSLRALFITDGHNPWSLNLCDMFVEKFKSKGLNPNVICPTAGSSETLTLSLRRPPTPTQYTNGNSCSTVSSASNREQAVEESTTARGAISTLSLSYGVVEVITENSDTSLILQDCGQVLPDASVVVIKLGPKPIICRSDEVGELCIAADYTGSGYWGLPGQTQTSFHVQPVYEDGRPITSVKPNFVRSGLIGFLGPSLSGGIIFICGSIDEMLTVAGRRHNANDIIATVVAIPPLKIVYRGRIAVFSVEMLKDERIVVVAELRNGFAKEIAFSWMSQVLQAVDNFHQAIVYALAFVPQNYLPRLPFGGIHLHEVRRLFNEGLLHPSMLLLSPHSAIQNLPKVHVRPPLSETAPSAQMVAQVVQGARLAKAQGRLISSPTTSVSSGSPGASDLSQQTLTEILMWRASHHPEDQLFSVYGVKGNIVSVLSCLQLHRRAERIGSLLQEKGRLQPGSVVALLYPPGTEMVCAFYGCLYAGAIPLLVRPPQPTQSASSTSTNQAPSNIIAASSTEFSSDSSLTYANISPSTNCTLEKSLDLAWNIVTSAKALICLSQSSVIKVIKSKDAISRIPFSRWPQFLDSDENWKKKLTTINRPISPDREIAYLDFSVETTGHIRGVEVTHSSASAFCRAQKMQCEFYPARELLLCLEPYSGLSTSLWLLASIYCGHHSILVPPHVTEAQPDIWLTLCSQRGIRDVFCSYATLTCGVMQASKLIPTLKQREVSLESLRSLVVVAEERPHVALLALFTKLFADLNLSSRAVSTSFGCRTNLAVCLRGANSPDVTTVYVDKLSLRNDRVKLLEKGSPNGLCLMESGKLLPGVNVVIVNPETLCQCTDSQLGEIWVSSPHNSSALLGPFSPADPSARDPLFPMPTNCQKDILNVRLLTSGVTETFYARTGFLGFVSRTELTQSDGELHDAVFVVGNLEETMTLRGMRFYSIDIENTVLRAHKKIRECAVFAWSNLLIVVVEQLGEESEALDLVHPITARVLEEHQLIVGVLVVVDAGIVSVNHDGEKERILLRDYFINDRLDPIYVSYNM